MSLKVGEFQPLREREREERKRVCAQTSLPASFSQHKSRDHDLKVCIWKQHFLPFSTPFPPSLISLPPDSLFLPSSWNPSSKISLSLFSHHVLMSLPERGNEKERKKEIEREKVSHFLVPIVEFSVYTILRVGLGCPFGERASPS